MIFGDVRSDGTNIVRNAHDGRIYLCANSTPQACWASSGETGHVTARSVWDNNCTGANFGTIRVVPDGSAASCDFACSIAPGC